VDPRILSPSTGVIGAALMPEVIRDLVVDDQRLRNDICWSVFDC